MKNTGIEYSSADRKPVILPEMAELLPSLSEEQLSILEADIQQNGCYTPIIVNEDMVIIDGHNRQNMCEKHGIPYKMMVFHFDDLLEAKQWALDTQKSRRNLEKWELGKIALKLKPEVEARAKAKQQEYHGNQYESAPLATLPEVQTAVDTRKELADSVGIGERTMGKIMQIGEYAPQAVKDALDKKELSINQGYKITKEIQELPEEEREQAAIDAVEYAKAQKELKAQNDEITRRSKIAKLFCKACEFAVQIDPTEENVRIWTTCTRMTLKKMAYCIEESRDLSKTFAAIADIIEQKILPKDWRNLSDT